MVPLARGSRSPGLPAVARVLCSALSRTRSTPPQGVGSRLHSPRVGGGSSRPEDPQQVRPCSSAAASSFFTGAQSSPTWLLVRPIPCVSRSPLGQALLKEEKGGSRMFWRRSRGGAILAQGSGRLLCPEHELRTLIFNLFRHKGLQVRSLVDI